MFIRFPPRGNLLYMVDMDMSHPDCLQGRTFWPAVEDLLNRQPPAASNVRVCIRWKELLCQGHVFLEQPVSGDHAKQGNNGPVICSLVRTTLTSNSHASTCHQLCPVWLLPLPHPASSQVLFFSKHPTPQPLPLSASREPNLRQYSAVTENRGFAATLLCSEFWPLLCVLSDESCNGMLSWFLHL